MRNSAHPTAAVLVMDIFLILAVLLGTNMLIALMTKSFDVIYEQQGINYMYLSALTTISWSNAPVVTPPFWLLGLPYYASRRGLSLAWETCCVQCPWVVASSGEGKASQYGDVDAEEGGAMADDGALSVTKLRLKMQAYVDEQFGEQGESERWRTLLARISAQTAKQVSRAKSPIIPALCHSDGPRPCTGLDSPGGTSRQQEATHGA